MFDATVGQYGLERTIRVELGQSPQRRQLRLDDFDALDARDVAPAGDGEYGVPGSETDDDRGARPGQHEGRQRPEHRVHAAVGNPALRCSVGEDHDPALKPARLNLQDRRARPVFTMHDRVGRRSVQTFPQRVPVRQHDDQGHHCRNRRALGKRAAPIRATRQDHEAERREERAYEQQHLQGAGRTQPRERDPTRHDRADHTAGDVRHQQHADARPHTTEIRLHRLLQQRKALAHQRRGMEDQEGWKDHVERQEGAGFRLRPGRNRRGPSPPTGRSAARERPRMPRATAMPPKAEPSP